MRTASFDVDIDAGTASRFAELSGDRNPLHLDGAYAAAHGFDRPVLHGAFAAGLLSRLAGMELPGEGALLHGMTLRFVAPISPPLRVRVSGRKVREWAEGGSVEAEILDLATGRRLVEGGYEFSLRRARPASVPARAESGAARVAPSKGDGVVLVTGARGGIGRSVLAALGPRGRALGRDNLDRPDCFDEVGPIAGIVHCGWPKPDDEALSALRDPTGAIERHVAAPLRQVQALVRGLKAQGTPGAMLVLVGSTASEPGRHAWRSPLYALAKGMVPTLARILALELGPSERRCVAALFDVVDGGMNSAMSDVSRVGAADRVPSGRLPSLDQAAAELIWLLDHPSGLISGATIALTGGAVP